LESPALVGNTPNVKEWFRHRTRPMTSVVVACRGLSDDLDLLVGILAPRCARDGMELVVVLTAGASDRRRIQRLAPQARIFSAPLGVSTAELRELGAAHARGDVLLLFDDTMPLPPHWEPTLPSCLTG